MATCKNTSRMSSLVSPLLMAPLTCALSSCGRFSALIIARFSMLRVLRSRPGRPQISPQQYSVTNSCSGRLKSSAVEIALSTYSAPSTSRRIFRPFSNISFSTCSPLKLLRFHYYAGPIFHHLDQLGHVGIHAVGGSSNLKHLT